MLQKTLLFSALLTACALLGFTYVQDDDEAGFVKIFNGKDFTGFKMVLQGNKENVDTFSVEDEVINVSGNPGGYVQTEKSYKNYVLRFDWKFPKRNGNSGCLVHITGQPMVWPRCFEVQGDQRMHGEIFGLYHKGKFTTDKVARKQTIKIGEWNTTEVISKDGELTSKINGVQVSTGKSEDATEGYIGWQSEGANVLFKNIRIKELP